MKIIFYLVCISSFSSTLYGLEIDKKAHEQALNDLELSKKQASLLLKDEMKKYDLTRLPPHYKKILDEQLFGQVPNAQEIAALKTKYDKVIAASIKDTASGTGGDFAKLNQSFKKIISGESKLFSQKIPYKVNVVKTPFESTPNNFQKNPISKYSFIPSSKASNNGSEENKHLKLFVNSSNKILKNKTERTIFDRHSEVYLGQIYSAISEQGTSK